DDPAERDVDHTIKPADGLATPAEVSPPAPATRIEIGHVAAMAIDPTQVEWWKDTDGDAETVGILEDLIERRPAAHGGTEQYMGLGLRADGEILDKKVPHVHEEKVLEATRLGVEEEAAGAEIGTHAAQAAVRGSDNARRQAAGDNRPIDRL